jgi:F-type H+-transporting ATPase subunit gamma
MIGIKEFNKKIVSLKNTRKMTKTMKMVSASKFKRAHKAQTSALDYANKLSGLMARLSGGSNDHELMKPKKKVQNALIIVFTSDKGLCGGFNNNLIRKVRSWVATNPQKLVKIESSFCGRRGYMSLRRTANLKKYYENVTVKPNFTDALTIANDVTAGFIKGEYDEVYLAFNRFDGPLSQVPVIEKLLPLDPASLNKPGVKVPSADYEYEPTQDELFAFLVPKFLNFKIYFTLLENAAGEHGARMSAMDKASQNTSDLIDRYTLLRNRARQAAITTELIEIISGAEALK